MPKVIVPEEIRKGLPTTAHVSLTNALGKFEQDPSLSGFRLKYVPNSDNRIICIRADQKARLVLGILKVAPGSESSSSTTGFLTTLGDEAVCVLLQVILHHNYNKAKFGEPAHVNSLMLQLADYADQYEQAILNSAATQEKTVPEYQKLSLGTRSYVLDEKQADALHRMESPALLTGSAGTGKSLLAIAQLQNYVNRSGRSERALYLVPSDYLKNKIKSDLIQACGQDMAERVDVLRMEEFFIQSDLVASELLLDKQAFYRWLAEHKKYTIEQYTPERLYLECSNRASFLSDEAYLGSGDKHSNFGLEDKQRLCVLYKAYLTYLNQQQKIDLGINPPTSGRPVQAYGMVVVDEAQCLGAGSLFALSQIFYPTHTAQDYEPTSLLFIADVNQVGITGARTAVQVLKCHFAERLISYHLDTSYRCPKAVIDVAQQCLNLAHQIRGELEKGASRATLKAPIAPIQQTMVRIANICNQVELKKIDDIASSHNTCLITSRDPDLLPAPLGQIALVLKPGTVVGLEMADVIIYEPFEREDMLGLLKLCENADAAKKNPTEFVLLLGKLLHLYTSLMRKTQDSGNVFVLSRFVGEPKYKSVWRFLFPGLVESPKKMAKKSPKTSPEKKSPVSPDKKQSSDRQWLATARDFAQQQDKDNVDRIYQRHLKSKMSYMDYCRVIDFQPQDSAAKKLSFSMSAETQPPSAGSKTKPPMARATPVKPVVQKKFEPSLTHLQIRFCKNDGYILLKDKSHYEALVKFVAKNEKKVVSFLQEKFASDPNFTFHWFLSKQALVILDNLSPKTLMELFNKQFKAPKLYSRAYPDSNGFNIFQLLLLSSIGRKIILGRISFFIDNTVEVIQSLLQEFDTKTLLSYDSLPKDTMYTERLSFLEYLLGEECVVGPLGHMQRKPKSLSFLVPEPSSIPSAAFGFPFEHTEVHTDFLQNFIRKVLDKVKLLKKEDGVWRARLLAHIFGKGSPERADSGVLWRLQCSDFGVHLLLNVFVGDLEDYADYIDFPSLFEPQASRILAYDGAPPMALMLMRCIESKSASAYAEMMKKIFKNGAVPFFSPKLIRTYPNVPYLQYGLMGLMVSGLSNYPLFHSLFNIIGHNTTKAFLNLCPKDFWVMPNTMAQAIGRAGEPETIPLRRLALDEEYGHRLLLYLYTAAPDFLTVTKEENWFALPADLAQSKAFRRGKYNTVFSLLLRSSAGLQVLVAYCRAAKDFSLLDSSLLSDVLVERAVNERQHSLMWIHEHAGRTLLRTLLEKKPEVIENLDLNDCRFETIVALFTALFAPERFAYLAELIISQQSVTITTLYQCGAARLATCSFFDLFGVKLDNECAWLRTLVEENNPKVVVFLEGLKNLAPQAANELEDFIVAIRGEIQLEKRIQITGDDEDGLVLSVVSMFATKSGFTEQGGEIQGMGASLS